MSNLESENKDTAQNPSTGEILNNLRKQHEFTVQDIVAKIRLIQE